MVRTVLALLMALAASPAAAVPALPAPKPLAPPPAQATETASGMSYLVIKPAPAPQRYVAGEFVQFQLDAWSSDGVTRANSRHSGPQVRSLQRLASEQPGLARAILSSPVGETRRWWFVADRLKPGYPGMPDLPHVMNLTVLGEKSPVETPADLTPPASATRTASGLAYQVLKAGPGGARPSLASTIDIHYSGWTSDGRLFDSSVLREERAVFPLQQLIPGWQEGLQLMAPGDTFRFWIPGPLAYDTPMAAPNTPKGTLVFDVTLFAFTTPP
jgi:peptidylprolyl isomerase